MTIECENALTVGSTLNGAQQDQYEIISILGAGGFGITYKARDHLLQADVAIKEYLPLDLALRKRDGATVVARADNLNQDYEWGLERFLDEARILSRFKAEPNIVRVESFLPANGTAYMVMQYEEGEALDVYLKQRGVLSEDQLRAILFPILDGLRVIHSEGILHRDIKPANIYLRNNGTPILLDFGAARQALGGHSHSVTGILTAGFAPFEQYSTRSKLSAAADIYSLGATLYKCITNSTPVEATERVAALHNDERDPLISAEHLVSKTYSPQIYKGLAWMMESLARDRPQSVEEVVESLFEPANESYNSSVEHNEKSTEISRKARPVTRVENVENKPLARLRSADPMQKTGSSKSKFVGLPLFVIIGLLASLFVYLTYFSGSSQTDYITAKEYYYKRQYKKSIPLFKKMAKENHALSEYYLSEIIRTKRHLKVDHRTSSDWFKRALSHGFISQLKSKASNDIPEYQSLLGLMYYRGTGVIKDRVQAVVWFRKSANNGHKPAMSNLGYMYSRGIGLKRDYYAAVSWYRQSANAGNPSAQSSLGRMCRYGLGTSRDYSEAVRWFRKSALQGYGNGQYQLGLMYQFGLGVNKDYDQAIKWYRRSTEQNNGNGQAHLGNMYRLGLGVNKDYTIAVKWYRKSASQGNRIGLYFLGLMYRGGQGVPKDIGKAVKLTRQSAIKGYFRAQVAIGLMYYHGFGVNKDLRKAVAWVRVSANQGYKFGQYHFARAYLFGNGVKKNYYEAFKWYRKSAMQGYVKSENHLGFMYEFGQGTKKDYKLAVNWYRKAAAKKFAPGQYNMGTMYHNGRGVTKDYAKAMEWYRLADAQNNALAQRAIGLLYEKGFGVSANLVTARIWFRKSLASGNKRAAADLKRTSLQPQRRRTFRKYPKRRRGGSSLFDGS